jgi:hypothetical protein
MMALLGAEDLGFASNSFSFHRTFQVDGFLTLLIKGVGYMIIPRFRIEEKIQVFYLGSCIA